MRRKIVTAGPRFYMKFLDLGYFREKAREADARVVPFSSGGDQAFEREIRDADALVLLERPLGRSHIAQLERCAVILAIQVGYDYIDVEAATEKGILVCNVPAYCTDEVAVHAFTLLLSVRRRIGVLTEESSRGGWNCGVAEPIPGLKGSSLGIVGLGRIGRALVPKAKGFGLEVAAYDPYLSDDIFALLGVRRFHELEGLLASSDMVSIHVPLTPETRSMIGERELAAMKRNAVLVNTSRGKVIDEQALGRAVGEGKIAGAGLDVLGEEPPGNSNPLLHMRNVIVTPHAAWYSETSKERLKEQGMDEVVRVLNGKRPRHPVNPEVLSTGLGTRPRAPAG